MGLPLSLFIFMPFLIVLSTLHLVFTLSSPFMQPKCHHDDSSALLQFKESFIIKESASYYDLNCKKVASWTVEGDKSDCCSWDGVECDVHTGHVIGLNLSSSCLFGSINSNSSLFRLVHLQSLNLSYNDFNGSHIPSQVRDLSRLIDLDLRLSNFSGQIPSEISQLSHLSSLDLSYNYMFSFDLWITLELKEPILRSLVANLTSLQKLDLSYVNISSTVPNILANLSSLSSLNLFSCGLHGEFPKDIFKLSKLRNLDVGYNYVITGFLPDFTWGSPLETLDLSSTSFSGELPASTGNFSFLTYLSMSGCNFSQSIPSSLGNLTKLTHLDLSNNAFVGNVPHSLGNLVQLSSLNIFNNQLTGPVPLFLGNLVQLSSLYISNNQLTGPVPLILGNLVQLSFLDISNNQLTGPVPLILGNLVQLSSLDISHNQLTGSIPFEIINLQQLLFVDLSYNLLHGEMHLELMNGTQLDFLKLNNNRLSGPILTFGPTTLQYLDLSNNFFTSFGQHPTFLPWTRLHFLDLRNNSLKGSLPILPINTSLFYISNNLLTGNIPESFCNLSSLEALDLGSNNLSGSLPECLDNFGDSLSILDLQRNKFEGRIPKNWITGGQLIIIKFSQNKFQGHLPRSLAKCTMLKVLDLSDNQFNGRFPFWLGHLPILEVLILRSNKFYGSILGTSQTFFKFPRMQIFDISHNDFMGMLPLRLLENWKARQFENGNPIPYIYEDQLAIIQDSYGRSSTGYSEIYIYSMNLTNKGKNMFYEKVHEMFMAIDFSSNKFVGEVPKSIENLKGVQLLNLSNNYLTGHIPPSLGNLIALEALDLSQNKLSGEIPQQLTQLTFLGFFDVSHNNLTGPIPQGKQFGTFENNSFEGNPGLCGRPLTKTCANFDEPTSQPSIFEESQNSRSPFEFGWKIVVIGYGFGFVTGVIIGPIVIARKHDWLMKTFRIRPLSRKRH
jgi:Leucine-rich repeat (LRR) protein